jgi:flagellar basal body-associated protein FliL
MPQKVRTTLWISIVSGLLIAAVGLSGCSMFSASNVPVDCDVVKTQAAAGQTDAQIASNLNAQVDQVAACHGPETGGNKNTIVPEKGY